LPQHSALHKRVRQRCTCKSFELIVTHRENFVGDQEHFWGNQVTGTLLDLEEWLVKIDPSKFELCQGRLYIICSL